VRVSQQLLTAAAASVPPQLQDYFTCFQGRKQGLNLFSEVFWFHGYGV